MITMVDGGKIILNSTGSTFVAWVYKLSYDHHNTVPFWETESEANQER